MVHGEWHRYLGLGAGGVGFLFLPVGVVFDGESAVVEAVRPGGDVACGGAVCVDAGLESAALEWHFALSESLVCEGGFPVR